LRASAFELSPQSLALSSSSLNEFRFFTIGTVGSFLFFREGMRVRLGCLRRKPLLSDLSDGLVEIGLLLSKEGILVSFPLPLLVVFAASMMYDEYAITF
jgi:hypothetical protein